MLKYANQKVINPKNQANNNFVKSSATRYNDRLGATLLTCCQSRTISCVRLYRTGPIGPGCTPAQFYSGPPAVNVLTYIWLTYYTLLYLHCGLWKYLSWKLFSEDLKNWHRTVLSYPLFCLFKKSPEWSMQFKYFKCNLFVYVSLSLNKTCILFYS